MIRTSRTELPPVEELNAVIEYDPETGLFRWRQRGRGRKLGWFAGTPNNVGYPRIWINGRSYLSHILGWALHHGDWPADELQIDHVDHKRPNDNRLVNLRAATASQNGANTGPKRNNKLGVKGVYRHRNGRYRAVIMVDYQRHHLGYFETLDEARAAYAAAAAHHFGSFARP